MKLELESDDVVACMFIVAIIVIAICLIKGCNMEYDHKFRMHQLTNAVAG